MEDRQPGTLGQALRRLDLGSRGSKRRPEGQPFRRERSDAIPSHPEPQGTVNLAEALKSDHDHVLLAARSGFSLLLLRIASRSAALPFLGGLSSNRARELLGADAVHRILVATLNIDETLSSWTILTEKPHGAFMSALLSGLDEKLLVPEVDTGSISSLYFSRLNLLRRQPGLTPFVYARLYASTVGPENDAPPPFSMRGPAPSPIYAAPRRHSAVFLHNNYYHYNCMTEALRRRGWDAITVSTVSPDHSDRQFFHGEDVNLFDPDAATMRSKVADFVASVPERFGSLHFYGMGRPTFFAENEESTAPAVKIPWDFFALREHQTVIGFMPSGCLDGGRQSSIRAVANNICGRCVWEARPDVCNDDRNGAWARKLEQICDWIGLEGDWAVDERTGPNVVRGPIVSTLDATSWRPDIEVPLGMRLERAAGELIVYHAVGNYAFRRVGDRDIKGTGATVAAIERLQNEGHAIKMVFATEIPSRDVKYIQVQADIVIDQLNYGRYGANARECLMLGRPVICRIDPRQGGGLPDYRPLIGSPIVDAGENSVYTVLKRLIGDRDLREEIGANSRRFAVRWHDSDVCAMRYERVVDRVRAGLPPEYEGLYDLE